MVPREAAGPFPRARRRAVVVSLAFALVLAATSYVAATGALGAGMSPCERFAAESAARAEQVTGRGERVVVIGDSWSAGLGLDRPVRSWPSRLPGRVHVAGFSGSGFSATSSPCGRVSFADRAGAVVAGADLVVVEGGLNDWDRYDAEIRAGFARLVRVLRGADVSRVVVVGPAGAPSRRAKVPHVDALLAEDGAHAALEQVAVAVAGHDHRDAAHHLSQRRAPGRSSR